MINKLLNYISNRWKWNEWWQYAWLIYSNNDEKGGNGGWECMKCEETDHWKSHLRAHIERTHIEGIKHQCKRCYAVFIIRDNLKVHIRHIHTKSNKIEMKVISSNIAHL